MFDRLKRWFAGKDNPPPDPRTLVGSVIEHDTFDSDDLNEIGPLVGALQTARRRLTEIHPTGSDLVDDLFYSLVRARPQLADREDVRPSHHLNHAVMAEAMDLPDWNRLHVETRNDPWFSAVAAAGIALKLEPILQRLADTQAQADRLDEKMAALADVAKEQAAIEQEIADLSGDASVDLQEQADELAGQAAELLAEAEQQAAKLDGALTVAAVDLSAAANDAVVAAADRVGGFKEMAALWGTDPGEFERMSAEEHMRLAQRLNSDELRELARLVGSMKFDVLAARSTKVRYQPTEVHSVERGNNLARLLPSELAKLTDPVRQLEFIKGYANRDLLQYKLRSEKKEGQGGIICAIDTSGSMKGQKMRWAKATSMLLMQIAQEEERSFTGILFSGPGRFKTYYFAKPEDFTTDRIIEWAEAVLGGGTDFETPLDEALRILGDEHVADGRTSGDVVLISDNECSVTEPWMERFRAEQARLQFDVFGVLIGTQARDWGLGMNTLTDNKVYRINDLFSAKEITPIYAAV